MNKITSLTVIIATYNRKLLLRKLLLQVYKNKPNNIPLDFKVIVVIDGSIDGTAEMILSEFPNVDIINYIEGNLWWTKSMNLGFKKAVEEQSDYVLILNDDVEIPPDYFINLLEAYQKLPKNSILGSISISINKPHYIESAGSITFNKWNLKRKPYINGFIPLSNNFSGCFETWGLSGRGTLIPAEVFKKIGFYDEKLIQYGSDDEFVIRARLNNIPVYISRDCRILNRTEYTSVGAAFNDDGLRMLIKSFFNKYSVNSIYKSFYLYKKYGATFFLAPLYVLITILGTIKSYYLNYKKK